MWIIKEIECHIIIRHKLTYMYSRKHSRICDTMWSSLGGGAYFKVALFQIMRVDQSKVVFSVVIWYFLLLQFKNTPYWHAIYPKQQLSYLPVVSCFNKTVKTTFFQLANDLNSHISQRRGESTQPSAAQLS